MAAAWDAAGQQVTCRDCGRTYTCSPADDYFRPDGEPPLTGPESGVCFGCLLRMNGLDPQRTQVMVRDLDGRDLDPREGYG